jgi:cyclic pyranopterin phosphate synthase
MTAASKKKDDYKNSNKNKNLNAFTHLDKDNKAKMVDVSNKIKTARAAVAAIKVVFDRETFKTVTGSGVAKGDIFAAAKIAAIMAAKKTAELIPLCHPIFLSCCDVKFNIEKKENSILIYSLAKTSEVTGVEMEAIIAAQTAAATIYDMCKAVSKKIMITDCRLIYKSGGKSGTFKNETAFEDAFEYIKEWL